MSLKRTTKPWFTQDLEQAMFATLALGLDPWFMGAAPAEMNRYFWPGPPNGELAVLSSCSGVPVTQWAYEACLELFSRIAESRTPRRASDLLLRFREGISAGIRDVLNVPPEAKMVLTQSPAEAYRLAALLLWFEADCKPMTAILPVSGEAVNLLPLAVQGRVADGEPRCGDAAIHEGVDVVQVALRQSDGRLRHDVQLLEAFHLEAERAVSQPVVYGTLGDGTGAVAPLSCPPQARLVLDATQMRLRPERVGDHLRRGWPVVISGSGFLGAPGATGAFVLPPGRFGDDEMRRAIAAGGFDFRDGWDPETGPLPYSGCVLRWLPAMDHLRGMEALGEKAEVRIAQMTYQITSFLQEFPDDIAVLDGRTEHHVAICGRDSGIVSFAIRDPDRPQRWLTMPDLIALYHDLAGAGVLLGHPVMAGGRAALRIAVSAEDVQYGDIGLSLARLADALTRTTGVRPLVRRRRGSEPGGVPRPGAFGASWATCRSHGPHPYC
jgi:hypothetical protein